jgi:hypothetical protein
MKQIDEVMSSRLVFRRFLAQISARTLGILAEVFRDFSQSLQAYARIPPQLGLNHLILNSFWFISNPTMLVLYSLNTDRFIK